MTTSGLKIEDNPFVKTGGVIDWLKRPISQPKPEEYLISKLIPANALACLQTNGVYGKTTLAMQLAMTVAFDLSFLGQYPCLQSGKVLFLSNGDTEDDNHRRFKRLTSEWSSLDATAARKIESNANNLSCISMYDDCLAVSPHLVDVSGNTTKTYSYLHQYAEYYKPKLIVLDPVEDFFPENLKSVSDFCRKLRQLNTACLLINGRKEHFGTLPGVEVDMFLSEGELSVKSFYTGRKDLKLEMVAGIWKNVEQFPSGTL